jgi:hypothetical protein
METPNTLFSALPVKESKKSNTHRITPSTQLSGDGVDAQVVIGLKLSDIAQSRPSKNGEGAIGFMFEPFTITVGEAVIQLNPGFTTVKRVR